MREVLVGAHVLVLEPAEQAEDRLQVPGGIAERPVVASGKSKRWSRRKMTCSARVSTRKSGVRPSSSAFSWISAVAEGVKGGDLHVGVAVGHERVDALFHLRGGLVGEGEGEDLGGTGPAAWR